MVDDYCIWAGPLVLLCHPLLARKLGRALARGEPCDLGRSVRGLDPDPWQLRMAALAVARGERQLEVVLG